MKHPQSNEASTVFFSTHWNLSGHSRDPLQEPFATPFATPLVQVHLTEREIQILILFQGCDKKGKAPDGRTYAEVAEKTEIREMLQQ